MGNKIDLCISYLPTGSCSDCDESRPDVFINITIPDSYTGDDKHSKYIQDHFTELLDKADQLIMDNFTGIMMPQKKQEWFAVFFRPAQWDLRKARILYGLDMKDNKTRMIKKIHSESSLIEREILEKLVEPMWVNLPEPPKPKRPGAK